MEFVLKMIIFVSYDLYPTIPIPSPKMRKKMHVHIPFRVEECNRDSIIVLRHALMDEEVRNQSLQSRDNANLK